MGLRTARAALMRAPDGFAVSVGEGGVLIGRSELLATLRTAGFARPERWQLELGVGRATSGRGASAVIELGGVGLRMKQLLRGGLAGPLWCERFVGTRRLQANLGVTLVAAQRGVPTPRPLALLLVPGPPTLWRGWLAVEELSAARDLSRIVREGGARPALESAMRVVRRMHDAGVEHRDLNLGNLLVRGDPRQPEAFVVDLDRARLRRGPLGLRGRVRALRRIERSHVKLLGTAASEEARAAWWSLYAADDERLARRLAGARRRGRHLIALHRLGGLR